MIVEYIRYRLSEHDAAALRAGYEAAAEHLQAAPQCLAFELVQCADDDAVFFLRIEWISVEEHTQGFRKGANFPPFFRAIRPFIPEIEEMRHYLAPTLSWRRHF